MCPVSTGGKGGGRRVRGAAGVSGEGAARCGGVGGPRGSAAGSYRAPPSTRLSLPAARSAPPPPPAPPTSAQRPAARAAAGGGRGGTGHPSTCSGGGQSISYPVPVSGRSKSAQATPAACMPATRRSARGARRAVHVRCASRSGLTVVGAAQSRSAAARRRTSGSAAATHAAERCAQRAHSTVHAGMPDQPGRQGSKSLVSRRAPRPQRDQAGSRHGTQSQRGMQGHEVVVAASITNLCGIFGLLGLRRCGGAPQASCCAHGCPGPSLAPWQPAGEQ
jgi:hypothetical protein